INLLVEAAVTAANPRQPGAYAATVRADLSDRHRPKARTLMAEHDELTADELASMLTADDKPEPPVSSPAASLPVVTATTPREPVAPLEAARERVSAIKASLGTI